ncbi:hypothetical protein HUT18_09945 [Streptomyces sp. NA04227]|uniref:hypothetical protein n=1 Tax=Streptomyces sp. NA04227 TaxID=2742136 RepID=UPI0015921823|nr:hypothetical protein [Streptomyces sp. NA04227]QKW06676.1 hypothetical protein HUT18_09945 [Streptomyces sp. NA04227]
MASLPGSVPTPAPGSPRPNPVFRALRGQRSPGEFAAAVRRAAREIGERVSCDARYVGRVEAGEIRCPNYAYERVFLHMFPGRTLADLGFAPRSQVRGRAPAPMRPEPSTAYGDTSPYDPDPGTNPNPNPGRNPDPGTDPYPDPDQDPSPPPATTAAPHPSGEHEALAVEEAVRRIRLLDDRHGAEGLYRRAAGPLRAAYALLDSGTARRSTAGPLHPGAGELALSVGWLAHDSDRPEDARSHYAEALATARLTDDEHLEAHAFSNIAFLARDAHRPREAVRAAQAGQRAAHGLGSPRLLALLALREAGGWAGLADRAGCVRCLARAETHFERGPSPADPEWMSFFGAAEFEGLRAQCWAALGDWRSAARHARRAVAAQDAHFTRNTALYTAELATDLARAGHPEEAAAEGGRVLGLLGEVESARVRALLGRTVRVLLPLRRNPAVGDFLERHAAQSRTT